MLDHVEQARAILREAGAADVVPVSIALQILEQQKQFGDAMQAQAMAAIDSYVEVAKLASKFLEQYADDGTEQPDTGAGGGDGA